MSTNVWFKPYVDRVGVAGGQKGDEGKGKIIDGASEEADVIIRCNGGANAGHTLRIRGKKLVTKLLPSGIRWDSHGKINVIASGVALNPLILASELKSLVEGGLTFKNLKVSMDARLVMPHHLLLDRLSEAAAGNGRIGTTGQGITPCYVDHVGRRGLRVGDMLDTGIFLRKLEILHERHHKALAQFPRAGVKAALDHPDLGGGRFYDRERILNVQAIVGVYQAAAAMFDTAIWDTDELLSKTKGRMLFEAAQGVQLGISTGAHPFVTSSDCSRAALIAGAGICGDIDRMLVLVKFPYESRVGRGPFPTELGGSHSDDWCNDSAMTKTMERERYPCVDLNSSIEFVQGLAIRRIADEYGSRTGRPRRVGWLDLPQLRRSLSYTGGEIILTMADVMSGCEKIKICRGYRYAGPSRRIGQHRLYGGETIRTAFMDIEFLRHCEPLYEEFAGWQTDITTVRRPRELPTELVHIVRYLEQELGLPVAAISVGPERDQIVML